MAERLGYTVEDLQDRMTMRELCGWIARDRMAADPMAFASMDDRIKHFMRQSIKHGHR